jgi:hypothetical protein
MNVSVSGQVLSENDIFLKKNNWLIRVVFIKIYSELRGTDNNPLKNNLL